MSNAPARFLSRPLHILALSLALLLVANSALAQEVVIRLTVERVRTNASFDALPGDNADFYAAVTFDGSGRSKSDFIIGDDDISPDWEFTSAPISITRTTPVAIKLEILDRDGGLLGGGDDRADIDPQSGTANLELELTIAGCMIGGDVTALCGEQIVSKGNGDDNAEIFFRIEVSDPAASGGLVIQCVHSPIFPQPGDMVTIEATPRELAAPTSDSDTSSQTPVLADIEIWFEDRATPNATALTSTTLTQVVGPVGDDFEYGCRASSAGRVAWSSWRRVGVGTDSAYGGAYPIVYTGVRGSRVDVVFLADKDSYSSATDPVFLQDVEQLMDEVYLRWPLFLERQDVFNFWIATARGEASRGSILGIPRCIMNGPLLPWMDAGAIIHTDIFRDCAARGKPFFSTEPPRLDTDPDQTRMALNTARHELGHRPFGLADEYAPDGGYYQSSKFPNLYEDSASCIVDAAMLGRFPSDCRSFRSDVPRWFDETWYINEPTNDLMAGNLEPRDADLRRVDWLLDLCRGAACSLSPVAGAGLEPGTDPTAGPFPVFDVDASGKQFVLGVSFTARDAAAMESLEVVKSPSPIRAGNPPLLRVEVFDANGQMMGAYDDWHPLWIHEQGDDGREELRIADAQSGNLIVPFDPEAATAVLIDVGMDMEVMEEDLTGAVRDFCVDDPNDPDCRQADLEVLGVQAIGAPPFVLFGTPATFTVRTQVTNNGPDAPEDGILDRTVLAAAELEVTPIDTSTNLPAIDVGELRDEDLVYQVECLAPGRHSVTFSSLISTAAPAAVDLFPGNNAGEISMTIDCAVPVSIDVKPAKVNLKSKGVIPVLVLATTAGENGNPLAFDPQQMDVSTARFGSAAVVSARGGAPEAHGRKHKRIDVMLHFRVQQTGLTLGDDAGCVIGDFTLPSGSPATFFGCESIGVK